ncbi:MAG: hypothetical protein H6701_14635 [Myxococcales bacterium]|nr:hypothetical protein [Myxococcales bacterium]
MSRFGWAGPAALAAALAGCGGVETRLDSQSGGDAARDEAMAIFLDRTVTDRIDGPEGDNTDWKYIDILDKGKLTIEVSFDTPEKLKGGEVEFTDEFGSRLERQPVTGGQSNYLFGKEVDKVPNKFFVRVFTKDGQSVYTVGSRMVYLPPENPPPRVEPEPEPEPEPTRPRRPVKRPTTPTKRPTVVKPPPQKDPEPPPTASGPTVATGRVIRVIPAEDDQSVTLTIRLSSADPVDKTTKATAYRGGSRLGRVTITDVTGRTITGVLGLPPGKATGLIEVRFEID